MTRSSVLAFSVGVFAVENKIKKQVLQKINRGLVSETSSSQEPDDEGEAHSLVEKTSSDKEDPGGDEGTVPSGLCLIAVATPTNDVHMKCGAACRSMFNTAKTLYNNLMPIFNSFPGKGDNKQAALEECFVMFKALVESPQEDATGPVEIDPFCKAVFQTVWDFQGPPCHSAVAKLLDATFGEPENGGHCQFQDNTPEQVKKSLNMVLGDPAIGGQSFLTNPPHPTKFRWDRLDRKYPEKVSEPEEPGLKDKVINALFSFTCFSTKDVEPLTGGGSQPGGALNQGKKGKRALSGTKSTGSKSERSWSKTKREVGPAGVMGKK